MCAAICARKPVRHVWPQCLSGQIPQWELPMFLILEFLACFITVCLVAVAILVGSVLGYALMVGMKKSARVIYVAHRNRVESQEASRLGSYDACATLNHPNVLA